MLSAVILLCDYNAIAALWCDRAIQRVHASISLPLLQWLESPGILLRDERYTTALIAQFWSSILEPNLTCSPMSGYMPGPKYFTMHTYRSPGFAL
jgi:hypothetical protein